MVGTGTAKRAALLLDNGFCEREYLQTEQALSSSGIVCRIVSSQNKLLKAWNEDKVSGYAQWGGDYATDYVIENVISSDFDILAVLGGRRSVEKLKLEESVRSFVSGFVHSGKPVIVYNDGLELLSGFGFLKNKAVAAPERLMNLLSDGLAGPTLASMVVYENIITLAGYDNVGEDIQRAVENILSSQLIDFKIGAENNKYITETKAA